MKKIGLMLLAILMFSGCAGEKACDVNAGELCFDEENGHYQIEDEVHLLVTVDSEAFKEALEALWDEQFPDHAGALEIVVADEFDGKAYLNRRPDVGLIWANEAARLDDWFLPIEERVKEELEPGLLSQYGESVNRDGYVYTPMFGYGWVFSSNLSLLEEIGITTTDENHDGLPDSLDTFEKITEWADSLDESLSYRDREVTQIFQFNFQDSVEAMAFLSLAGFTPFEGFEAEAPGWDSELFLTALSDLAELGRHEWTLKEKTPVPDEESEGETDEATAEEEPIDPARQESSDWGAEFYLSDAASVFSMVGTWMYYEEQEALTEQDFSFSAMPTWHEATLHPYTLSAGYVIRKDTDYPNACHELLRLIRSDAGLQAYAAYGSYPLLYNYYEERLAEDGETADPLSLDFPSENRAQISYAMMEGREESMVAFKKDARVRGWTMIEETGIYEILEAVFEQTLTPEAAQQQIVEKTSVWMQDYVEEETEEEK